MKLHAPFIQLPLRFDAVALADEIAGVAPSLWKPHPQGFAGNTMLPLVAVDGDPDNEAFTGPMRPTPVLQQCPGLRQVFAALGATVGRSRLMRLSGHAEVARHADQGYYWAERVRVHVPITTQPTVRFECGSAAVHMAPGECWIFDTWRQHRVLNDADESRVHLVVDTVGGGRFWDLVARGRAHPGGAPPDWRPVEVGIDPGVAGEFACERVNIPEVMTPWELNTHFSLLFGDARPHPGLPVLRHITGGFVRTWQGLWFEHGTSPEGRESFRQALELYLERISGPARGVRLANELDWYGAVVSLIGRSAVGDPFDAGSTGPAMA